MVVEIVSVGTELLMGQITDTNAAYIAARLPEAGCRALYRQTVGDNLQRLVAVLRTALDRADAVITIGGLGPTPDDLTRQGIADAIGEPLIEDPELRARLEALFKHRNYPLTSSQYLQALRPVSATALDNPNGTAPGLSVTHDGKRIYALPGPPNELIPMFDRLVLPELRRLNAGQQVILSRMLRVCGIGEALAAEKLGDLLDSANPTVAPYAKLGEVHFRLSAAAPDPDTAIPMLDAMEREVRNRLGNAVYGVDDETLENVVVRLLAERHQWLSVAESCTGGLLGSRLTDVPGASAVLSGGVIAYSNRVKQGLLGVPEDLLTAHGAVSEPVVLAMAQGARQRFHTDWAIAISGVAGPDGGTPDKPVGTVWICVDGPGGPTAERMNYGGQRTTIKWRATQTALVMLRERLMA